MTESTDRAGSTRARRAGSAGSAATGSTRSPDSAESGPLGDRITYAVRQGALMAAALWVAGGVTERLRPDALPDRGILGTPFLWAIVTWIAVLVFHAIAFEQSEIRRIEREPLALAAAVGGFHLVVGVITLDGGSFGRRLVYLVANSVGALVFWWAVFSFGVLLVQLMGRPPSPSRAG